MDAVGNLGFRQRFKVDTSEQLPRTGTPPVKRKTIIKTVIGLAGLAAFYQVGQRSKINKFRPSIFTKELDASPKNTITSQPWSHSGVLTKSLGLATSDISTITNITMGDFYLEGFEPKYNVNDVYLTYRVTEDIPRTGSETTTALGILYYPDTTDDIKGLIVIFPGTTITNRELIKDSTPLSSPGQVMKAYASSGYAVLYNYNIGLEPFNKVAGVTSGDKHQRYSIAESTEIQTSTLLSAVVDYAVEHSLSMPDKKLFLMGHSLGGFNSAAYHLYYQTLKERKFNLMATISSSGTYDLTTAYADGLKLYDRSDKSSNGQIEHVSVGLALAVYEWHHYLGGIAKSDTFKSFVGMDLRSTDDNFGFMQNILGSDECKTSQSPLSPFSEDSQESIRNYTFGIVNGKSLYERVREGSINTRYSVNSIPLILGVREDDYEAQQTLSGLRKQFDVEPFDFEKACRGSRFEIKDQHRASEICLFQVALDVFGRR